MVDCLGFRADVRQWKEQGGLGQVLALSSLSGNLSSENEITVLLPHSVTSETKQNAGETVFVNYKLQLRFFSQTSQFHKKHSLPKKKAELKRNRLLS